MTIKQHLRSSDHAFEGADALILMTCHDEFKNLELKSIAMKSKDKLILIDGRRAYRPESISVNGIRYVGIGKNQINEDFKK